MFGLFKKDFDQDFEFHKGRMEKLLAKAQKRFERADNYLCGEGFGGQMVQKKSANGAVGKAQSALKEAIFNAQDAVKYSRGDHDKKLQIKSAADNFSLSQGKDIFLNQSIIDIWDQSIKRWTNELDGLLK
jgi:uncharacterized protein YjbJ (UPF0337 family)